MLLFRNLFLSIFTFISLNIMAQENIYSFNAVALDGSEINFSDFTGKKILIVNTASKCGFTPQYEKLQKLWELKKDSLVIIGFPANNFGKQEPGSDAEIQNFCSKNYGVTFIMASKVSVKGNNQNELFTWLCSQENPDFTGTIRWNFEKFLLNENGVLIHRFRSNANPLEEILKEI